MLKEYAVRSNLELKPRKKCAEVGDFFTVLLEHSEYEGLALWMSILVSFVFLDHADNMKCNMKNPLEYIINENLLF
jgi:hypothetical protein